LDTQGFELVPREVVAEAKVVAFTEAFLTAWCISGATLCVCVCVFVCGCLCMARSDVAGVCDKFSKVSDQVHLPSKLGQAPTC
jgi:hypothetical protein